MRVRQAARGVSALPMQQPVRALARVSQGVTASRFVQRKRRPDHVHP
ncbi:hypothetical protein X805_07370 [Sphaerotilus natans subsp. natans DSM 6575]|uniref:Uncharacterized protein n=1 Tax=Sphaerotilus natans subsp. natans DSM 6575 TaxID=1286631 RepID=A0A059KQM1_9BURK|nr:hypothetical protein X805_07370 [Sphaerotilus natans subsp. natans DSM 6575]